MYRKAELQHKSRDLFKHAQPCSLKQAAGADLQRGAVSTYLRHEQSHREVLLLLKARY